MDTRPIFLVALAVYLLISHGSDLWGLLKSAGGLFRRKTSPADNQPQPGGTRVAPLPSICELVASYVRLRPHLTPEQATEAWAVIEPQDAYQYEGDDYQSQPEVAAVLPLVSAWTLLRPYLTADQARMTWAKLEASVAPQNGGPQT